MPELLERNDGHKGRIFQVEIDVVKLCTRYRVYMEIVRHAGSVGLLSSILELGFYYLDLPISLHDLLLDLWAAGGQPQPKKDPNKAAARECEEEIRLVPGRADVLSAATILRRGSATKKSSTTAAKGSPRVGTGFDGAVCYLRRGSIQPRTFTLAEAQALDRIRRDRRPEDCLPACR